MRAALMALLAGLALPAAAGTPLALGERQVVALEFQQPVVRVTTTDPDLLQVKVAGTRVSIAAARAGRASLELSFADGASVGYDVTVDAARRAAARPPPASNEIALGVGEERRLTAPGVARVLVEENGIARVAVNGDTVSVVALARGDASLVVVDAAGSKVPWQIRVR